MASDPDEMYYQFRNHLPLQSLNCILKYLTNLRHRIILEAIVRVTPKHKKYRSLTYRPFSFISFVYKTLIRNVYNSLVWYLESHNILNLFEQLGVFL